MGSKPEEIDNLLQMSTEDWWVKSICTEAPQRLVKIEQSFWIGIYPVTVAQFCSFVDATGYLTEGEREGTGAYCWDSLKETWQQKLSCTWYQPGFDQSDENPVVCVSWNDAIQFCSWLSLVESLAYRLPKEEEWEYAARAGTQTATYYGDSLSSLQANFNGNYPYGDAGKGPYLNKTAPVGRYLPNAFGLYDMHGNVYEWCANAFRNPYEQKLSSESLSNINPNTWMPVRGGAWNTIAARCRAASRKWNLPNFRSNRYGFRVACTVPT